MQFLRDNAGIETVEYAVATALLIAGVLIGVGGLLLAILPMLQRLTEIVFSV
jgi:Flp pilus assembly pilin Flp